MNLGFDDNSFFLGGGGGVGGGRKKKQMKWQKKMELFEAKHQKRVPFGWNAGSTKNFEINPLPPDPTSHTLPHLSGFELGRMLSVTFEK